MFECISRCTWFHSRGMACHWLSLKKCRYPRKSRIETNCARGWLTVVGKEVFLTMVVIVLGMRVWKGRSRVFGIIPPSPLNTGPCQRELINFALCASMSQLSPPVPGHTAAPCLMVPAARPQKASSGFEGWRWRAALDLHTLGRVHHGALGQRFRGLEGQVMPPPNPTSALRYTFYSKACWSLLLLPRLTCLIQIKHESAVGFVSAFKVAILKHILSFAQPPPILLVAVQSESKRSEE